MPNFSRKTILAATDLLEPYSHAGIDKFLLEQGLESVAQEGSKAARANTLAKLLITEPERLNEDGENLSDTVVEALIQHAIRGCTGYGETFDYGYFQSRYGALHRGLERDGFTLEDGQLRRALPEALDLPEADDEVHALLDAYDLRTPKGHLGQAIAAHSRGEWAAANGQIRSFIESLFDEIAERLNGGAAGLPPPGNQRREWLALRNPPFFIGALNEWAGQGTGFLQGFYRRLHPQGAHPGLSDEDDSTFRLHLVLLVARLLLRRLQQMAPRP